MDECKVVIDEVAYAIDLLEHKQTKDAVDSEVFDVLNEAHDQLCKMDDLLKAQRPKTGHWVAKSNVSWHENGDDDATPVFYATLSCSECGKPYRYDVAYTLVDYDEWAAAYIPNGPVLNDKRTQIYDKAFEQHKERIKSLQYDWVSCPYCGAKME